MAYQKQTWEDLPSTNTPITATRLNHIENGIADVETGLTPVTSYTETDDKSYACNYLNENIEDLQESILDIFSTDEIKTNKIWIDEKPIYRKVLTGTKVSGTVLTFPAISNIEQVTFFKGILKSEQDRNWYDIPFYNGSEVYVTLECSSSGNVKINSSSSGYANGDIKVTIEYTKTTD